MAHFLEPLLDPRAAPCALRNERTREVLATRIETAFDSRSRRTGLLGRDSLAAGAALVIAPCDAIHTFFMRFPIDAMFVAKSGAVRKIKRRLAPWRITASLGSFATIEFAAGELSGRDIRVGDRLVIERQA
jgi:uncharacterized membrane protein (UPF0127 family)